MRRYWGRLNPTVRGLLIIALIALVVVVLQLDPTLVALSMLLRVAFFLAVAFFLSLVCRERLRGDIETCPRRAQLTSYGGAAVIVFDLGVLCWTGFGVAGLEAVALILALALSAFAMWRVWREQHTYSV